MLTVTFEKKCAIMKHLLTNPQFAEEINFCPEYFVPIDSHDEPSIKLSKLYDATSKLIWNHDMPYSYQTMEIAYFDKIANREISSAYCHPENADDNMKRTIEGLKMQIKAIYDNCETFYSSLSTDFIEYTARELSNLQVWVYRANSLIMSVQVNNQTMKETDSLEEFSKIMESEYNKIEQKYMPPMAKVNIYTDMFDSRLRVKVSDKVFPSYIGPLNRFLSGGFKTQTVTGFMTKTGGGKSTLLFTLAADALSQGQNVAFINLEMNDYEVNSNILSALCKKKTYKEIIGSLTDDEFFESLKKDVPAGTGRLAIISDEDGHSSVKWLEHQIERTEKKIRKQTGNDRFKFDLVIVDYLFLMEPSKRMLKNSRSDESYRQVTVEFHKFCQVNEYAGISVFQGNRGAESKLANSEKITLADIGDAYSAIRDIEYTFSISRYIQPDGEDGILIQPLKTRHYDGSYDEGAFVKYDYDYRCYDSINSERVNISDIEPEKTSKKGKNINKVTIGEVLDADPDLWKHVCQGTLQSTCAYSRRVENVKSLLAEAEKRGIELKRAKDFETPDYNAMKKRTMEAIDKAYSMKYSGNKAEGLVIDNTQVSITGKELFE